MSPFAENLRFLCARQRSVSEICRQIDINRQQFARYLAGAARPSAHNLRRIGQHFGVPEGDLDLPHDVFVGRSQEARITRPAEMLTGAFPGDTRRLRRMAGTYHAHFLSPSHPGHVVRALVNIFERDGFFHSRTIERIRHAETGQLSLARFVGLVSVFDETLFMVERGRFSRGGVSETILAPVHRGSGLWLTGLVLGFSWRNRKPYASQCVWKRLRQSMSVRAALTACDAVPLSSRRLEPFIVEQLRAETEGSGLSSMIPAERGTQNRATLQRAARSRRFSGQEI